MTLLAAVVLAGCGEDDKPAPAAPRNTAGMDPQKNAATATRFFTAVASNDPAQVEAAYDLAAPASPALSYLEMLHDGLDETGEAATMTVNNGRYKLCLAAMPNSCHTFAGIVLSDGKVLDFTIDGKRIRIR